MIKLGSFTPFKSPNYLLDAGKFSIERGANAMMIFLGPPQSSLRASVDKMKVNEYIEQYSKDIPLENILVHGPYIINPGNPEKYQFAIDFITKELKMMEQIGLSYYVLHPGAQLKFGEKVALDHLVKTLKQVLKNTDDVNILLETMSGKGTEIGYTFEQLEYVTKKVNSPRLGICLDICHLYSSGVDVNDYSKLITSLKKHKLLSLVKAIHVNNSQHELGARKDRHAILKDGTIPFKSIKKIVNGKEFKDAIKVLETPWINGKDCYKEEIRLLLK